jgi:predicted alpha/beta hydrolase
MLPRLNQQSIIVPVGDQQLHITRLYLDDHQLGAPLLMLHDAMHDSSLFYPGENRGLADFMARQGFDVFVLDLRGKGQSWPAMNAHSAFGFHTSITIDLPALLSKVAELRPGEPQIWLGAGWGGVLLAAFYARFGDRFAKPRQCVFVGSARCLPLNNWRQRWVFNGLWQRLARLVSQWRGFLPANRFMWGDSAESSQSLRDLLAWQRSEQWLDSHDGFDYAKALLVRQLPPSLYLAAADECVHGTVAGVRAFMHQLGKHDGRLLLLSKAGGCDRNYQRRSMLLAPSAVNNHFSMLSDWLRAYAG